MSCIPMGVIDHVDTKHVIVKSCRWCQANDLIKDEGPETYYCAKCRGKMNPTEPAKWYFRLQFQVIHDRQIETIVAFDKTVEELIGCSARDFEAKMIGRDMSMLSDYFLGMHCCIMLRDSERRKKFGNLRRDRIAHRIIPLATTLPPFVNLLSSN